MTKIKTERERSFEMIQADVDRALAIVVKHNSVDCPSCAQLFNWWLNGYVKMQDALEKKHSLIDSHSKLAAVLSAALKVYADELLALGMEFDREDSCVTAH